MVVIKTAMILMDLGSVNKRNNEQTPGTNFCIIWTFFLPIDYLSNREPFENTLRHVVHFHIIKKNKP